MIDYCVVDEQGFVAQSGTVQEECLGLLDIPAGHRLIRGVRSYQSGTRHRVLEDGSLEDTGESLHAPDYRLRRKRQYPEIGDQLEAIWEALDAAGVVLPAKAQVLKQQIAEVKQQIPKIVESGLKGG